MWKNKESKKQLFSSVSADDFEQVNVDPTLSIDKRWNNVLLQSSTDAQTILNSSS